MLARCFILILPLAAETRPGQVYDRPFGLKTQRHLKGVTVRTVTPWFLWLRGADLNRRPLGYEPTPGSDCNRLRPTKATKTRSSPSPPFGGDRRLLEGVPAQFPHNRGSLV